MLSGDGRHWWDGRRWLAAGTPDGLWRWDGAAWVMTVAAGRSRPREVARLLAALAEARYAEAGKFLAERGRPAAGPGHAAMRSLQQIRRRGRRLQPAQSWLEPLGRLDPGQPPEHELVRQRMEAEVRSLQVRIGRSAARPAPDEVEPLLEAARALDETAAAFNAAADALDQGARRRAARVADAKRALLAAEATRQAALRRAREAVAGAAADHARDRAQARNRLRRLHRCPRGELVVELRELRLYANLIHTPEGWLPAAGAAAHLGTAAALWAAHRDLLTALAQLRVPGADSFLDALIDGAGVHFLLIAARTGACLWVCPDGDLGPTREFVTRLAETSIRAVWAQAARAETIAEAERELARVRGDRPGLEAAEAERARVSADPELRGPIEAARHWLERAQAETPEMKRAQEWADELWRRLSTPPDPLRPSI